jgi:DNA-binding XRE family transcriptional regulator
MKQTVMDVFSIRQGGENVDRRNLHNRDDAAMKKIAEQLIERESRPDKVGARITALRETLCLSKAEFADTIALDRSSLSKIEKGTAGLDIASGERIAVIYGFGLDFIYRGDLSDVPQNLRPQLMVNLVTYRQPR